MRSNEITNYPLPKKSEAELSAERYRDHLAIDKWDQEKSFKVLVHISEGKSSLQACELEGTNIRSLHYYSLQNKDFKDNLDLALKLNARVVHSRVQEEFVSRIDELQKLDIRERAVAMNRLYKYFERFTALHDKDMDLKLRQAKDVAEVQQESRAKDEVGKKGMTLVIKNFLDSADKKINVQNLRVDRDGGDDDDKTYQTIS